METPRPSRWPRPPLPIEHGVWFFVGLPWAMGMVATGAPPLGWLLGLLITAVIMAREPLFYWAWAARRRLRVSSNAPWGLAYLAAAAACAVPLGAALWDSAIGWAPPAAAAFLVATGGFEALVRLRHSRPFLLGDLLGAVAGVALLPLTAALRGPVPPRLWALAADIALIEGTAAVAMRVRLLRVPRRRGPLSGLSLWFLPLWIVAASILVAVIAQITGLVAPAAVAIGLGATEAARTWWQGRSTDFRRLGWTEAAWVTSAALVIWIAWAF